MSVNDEMNEKLYNGYLRKKMACIASAVKVRQIIPHLPCLTTHDREEIEAKRDTSGNYNAMQLLLACLKTRANWPAEFISALEACEHTTMAAEMRQEYDSLRAQGNPNPPAPAAHVVTAHVHPPPPSANQSVSIPESVSNNQAAVVLPPLAPPEPAVQVSPPPAASAQPETPAQSESETPPSLAAEASAKAASSSDPAPQAPQSPPMQAVHPQATPPASPETPHHPTTTTSPSPPPVHQEPEESSDVDLQVVSGDKGPFPDEGIDGDSEVSGVSFEVTPDPEPPVEETPDPEPPVKPPVEVPAVAAALQPLPPQTNLDETDELPVEVTPEPGVDETPDPEPPVEETPEPKAPVEVTSDPSVEETPDPEPPVEETPEPKAPVEVTSDPPVEETPEVTSDPEPTVEETLEPEPPVEIHAVASTLQPHPVQTATPEVSPPQSPSPPQTDLDETDESTSTIMTPEKCPVQDTTLPEDKVAPTVLEPEEQSDPIAAQVTQNCLHTDTTGTTTLPADGQNASLSDEDDVHVSKPGLLLSNEEPCSGNTACLEFSEAAADSELTTQVTAPAVACSGAILVHQATPAPSPPPCQENGVVEELLPHNEPEENQYESPCQSSRGDHGVVVNVVHVSEPPSIQNQDGQTPSMLGNANVSETQPVQTNNSEPEIAIESPSSQSSVSPELSSHSCEDNQDEKVVGNGASMSEGPQLHIRNGQATSALTKEFNSAPELPATAVTVSFNAASNDNCHPSESGAAGAALELKPQDPMDKKPSSSTKYLMTAAGVGACALLMAWKLKH